MKTISIFGGTGFIGTELIGQLAKQKVNINVYTRNINKADKLKVLPRVKLIQIKNLSNISELLKGSDTVINLVGILHETKKQNFLSAHKEWVEKIVLAIKKNRINRFIHLGAMQSSKYGPSNYLKTKYAGDQVIKNKLKNSAWTIFKPSIVFGENDKFINLFKKIISFLPIIFLISPKAKFQPVYVKDLVDIIIKSINDKKTHSKIFNIAGPKSYSFREIIELIAVSKKKSIVIIPMNKKISYLIVRLLELLPIKIITRDNLKSMEVDNVSEINDSYCFKTNLMTLPAYLKIIR